MELVFAEMGQVHYKLQKNMTLHYTTLTHPSDRTTNQGPQCVFIMHAKRSHAHVKCPFESSVDYGNLYQNNLTCTKSVRVVFSVELSEEENTKTLINHVDCQHSKL